MGSTTTATYTSHMVNPSFIYTFPEESPLSQSQFNYPSKDAIYQSKKTNPSSAHPNRRSCPNSNTLWQKHQQQMQMQTLQEKQQEWERQHFQEKGMELQKQPPSPTSGRAALPRLSLDTSIERLQSYTVIQHGDKSYLKLFSPTLVESPVSFLSEKQAVEDKKLWENGPDEAFQKKLDMERREAFKARSMQQIQGIAIGIWLGCLMGLLILQQTPAKVFIPNFLASHDTSPMFLFMTFASCLAVFRAGTRCIMTAVATLAAVLVFFATIIVNQSPPYSVQFQRST